MYGQDEMSTINQRQLMLARRIAQKLCVSGGLSDALGPAPLSHPIPLGPTLGQIIPARVSTPLLTGPSRERDEKQNAIVRVPDNTCQICWAQRPVSSETLIASTTSVST